MADSDTTLLPAFDEVKEESGDGVTWVRISLNGDQHCSAAINAVVDGYNAITGRPRPTVEELESMIGEKVTLIYGGESQFGASLLKAREGKLFAGTRGLGILPKGARKNGYTVDPERVIDFFPGYATAKAQELVNEVRGCFPALKAITQERLEELPHDSDTMSLAVFGTRRMPDETTSDAVWLFSSYWREDDILDKAVLLIRPSAGFSEAGSEYGRHILREPYGEVIGFQPISFAEAIELCDLDYMEAYTRLFGSTLAPA